MVTVTRFIITLCNILNCHIISVVHLNLIKPCMPAILQYTSGVHDKYAFTIWLNIYKLGFKVSIACVVLKLYVDKDRIIVKLQFLYCSKYYALCFYINAFMNSSGF